MCTYTGCCRTLRLGPAATAAVGPGSSRHVGAWGRLGIGGPSAGPWEGDYMPLSQNLDNIWKTTTLSLGEELSFCVKEGVDRQQQKVLAQLGKADFVNIFTSDLRC